MTVFFDIDDTLYDRGLPFIATAQEFFHDTVADPRKAYRACTSRGNEVFLSSQRGEISMDEMYIYRWCKGFADVGISITPKEALDFQRLYRQNQDRITLSSVIEEMLQYCSQNADGLGIISNGPSEKQWNKISRLGLERFIARDMMIISGDIGIDKPDAAIFRLAEQRSGKRPDELLYVGDSLKNDMYSAAACGWHTIWFNCDVLPVPTDIHADAIVETQENLAEEIRRFI